MPVSLPILTNPKVISTNQAKSTTPVAYSGGEDVLVQSWATVQNTGPGSAILLIGDNHVLELRGAATGQFGVQIGASTQSMGNHLALTETGMIHGQTFGALLTGAVDVSNNGQIRGNEEGIRHYLDKNSVTYLNAGSIVGGTYGIDINGDPAGKLTVVNEGTVSGGQKSYWGGGNVDSVTNTGTMIGTVDLASGNDVFDTRTGKVTGDVLGGAGDDRFLLGNRAEVVDGGQQDKGDILDFRSGGGLTVSLANSALNTGRAKGDTYTNIERIWGSDTGGDQLTGDGGNNVLRGYGGADKLKGGAGLDRLMGGAGADTLTGGSERDSFCFNKLSEGGDTIIDFSHADDEFAVKKSGFGGGLVMSGEANPTLVAAQFVARATDNHAQDSSDRFIFEKDSTRLWFDADGNGAGAAKLVADLQAGAVVDVSDILLF